MTSSIPHQSLWHQLHCGFGVPASFVLVGRGTAPRLVLPRYYYNSYSTSGHTPEFRRAGNKFIFSRITAMRRSRTIFNQLGTYVLSRRPEAMETANSHYSISILVCNRSSHSEFCKSCQQTVYSGSVARSIEKIGSNERLTMKGELHDLYGLLTAKKITV